MKREWLATGVYVAIAWIVYFAGELGGSVVCFFATLGYFVVLLAGAIALIVRLVMNLVQRRSILAVLAMALAVLPFCFMLEIREAHARADDFFLRDERMQVIEQIESGALRAERYGFIDLPEEQAHLSEDGDLHILGDGRTMTGVEFYQFRALLGGAFSAVWCADGNPPTEEMLKTEKIQLCKPLGGGWYCVSYE